MKKIIFGVFVLIFAGAGGYAYSYFSTPAEVRGLTKVSGYKYIEPGMPACQSFSPECGHCPGKVVDRSCYVDVDTLDDFEKNSIGL